MNALPTKLLGLFAALLGWVGVVNAAQVTLTIREAGRTEPLPARVHLQDSSRQPVKPPGSPAWHDHFVCAGSVEVALSSGEYRVEIERGPEFSSVATNFTVGGSATNFSFTLSRIADLAREGWWSGETHVHRKPQEAELLMRAEDLHVAHFTTWWNKANPWTTEPLPHRLPVRFDGNRFYHPLGGEDERDGGALLYLDLTAPLDITGGTRHRPSSVAFVKQAREHGAKWIDAEKPFWWDFPMWVAHGVVDTVGIAHNHMQRDGVLDNEAWGRARDRAIYAGPQGNGRYTQDIYYHLLNTGSRLPPSAGSASGVLPNPVGYNRAYVHVAGEFTYEKWRDGLKAGRSFVSNGPLLRARANGFLPGHVFRTNGSLQVLLEATLDSRDPVAAVELVRNGHIERVNLPSRITLQESGWFLLRAIANVTNTFRFAGTAPWYVEVDGKPMHPRRESAQFFVDWSRERMAKLEALTEITVAQKEELLQPWREAETFWRDRLTAARRTVAVTGHVMDAATRQPLNSAKNSRAAAAGPLDPRGKVHIPIGLPDSVDTLKTFVEAEGSFSPGFGSYGIYFWLWDAQARKLTAPTMDDVTCEHGLKDGAELIPWSRWKVGGMEVTSEVCETRRASPKGDVFVVGARVQVVNRGTKEGALALYAALRPLGPAGGDVVKLAVSDDGGALLVNDHPALVSAAKPQGAGVSDADTIGDIALRGELPTSMNAADNVAASCSGALRFELKLKPGERRTLAFVCPVLPGRSAAAHEWKDLKLHAMTDVAPLNPPAGGVLQPDPGMDYYRALSVDELFAEASRLWQSAIGSSRIQMPDNRWDEAWQVILSHASLCLNEGAPDVAVINYNVFNRDGIYVVSMLQKSGQFALAARSLDYFMRHPFNGRAYPEADNPGQVLWALAEQYRFTRDDAWLARAYPAVRRLARMITYYRTTPEPHFVNMGSLDYGDALPAKDRQLLKPGSCDGHHPEYTEAFDLAALRGAALLADAARHGDDAAAWRALAEKLMADYDAKFGAQLIKGYGGYSVLWPCRIYPFGEGRAHDQFVSIGAQAPKSWRYFPLATAHQGLLAGNRRAGHGTLSLHLDHPQMQGWYAFDEGGGSGGGGWHRARTTWPFDPKRPGDNRSVAMPHGWAIAELWLLMRDALCFEAGERLVLFAGVAEDWFRKPMRITDAATHFGKFSAVYRLRDDVAVLTLSGDARPPGGFILRLPANAVVKVEGKPITVDAHGDYLLPSQTRAAAVVLPPAKP